MRAVNESCEETGTRGSEVPGQRGGAGDAWERAGSGGATCTRARSQSLRVRVRAAPRNAVARGFRAHLSSAPATCGPVAQLSSCTLRRDGEMKRNQTLEKGENMTHTQCLREGATRTQDTTPLGLKLWRDLCFDHGAS